MERLDAVLQRLYGESVSGRGRRVLLLVFRRSCDWPGVAGVVRVVQEDLALPAPAVSVSGDSGFIVWFALDGTVSAEAGRAFLAALRQTALIDIAESDLDLLAMPEQLPQIPACCANTGRWSAFIDPSMGSLFVDEAGLDFGPPPDRQADLLAGLACIDADSLQAALSKIAPPPNGPQLALTEMTPGLVGPYAEPEDFLRAVMNDPAVPLVFRIEAAKGLLSAAKVR